MAFLERHIFLLLAALAFGLSVLCYTFLERDAPGATDEQYVVAVQERVKAEMQTSHAELNQVVAKLKQSPKFTFGSLYESDYQYPYFIFKNRRLLFWSDNRFIPDYARVADVTLPRVVEFDQGQFVVSRKTVLVKPDSFVVVSMVPVYRRYTSTNNYLKSGYNPSLFTHDPLTLTTQRGPAYQNVYDDTPVFLFSVVPPRIDPYHNHSTPVNTVILATLGVLLLGIYVMRRISWAARKRQYELGFLWLLCYLLLLRGLMLYTGVPFLFVESDLFNAKYYAASELSPSLGDLLLNSLALVALAFHMGMTFYRSRIYFWVIHLPLPGRAAISFALILCSNYVYYLCLNQLNALYEKSQYTLDLSLSIQFPPLKIASLLFFVVLSLLYFLTQHILASLFLRLNEKRWQGLIIFLVGTLISVSVWLLFELPTEPVCLLNMAYFLGLYLSNFPRYLYTFRYKTSLYLFLGSFVCAATAATVVYSQHLKKDLITKQDIGKQLLAENDQFGEFLLHKASASIDNDPTLRRIFQTDSLLKHARIQKRVKIAHLDRYFDKYDVEVSSFDGGGHPLDLLNDAVSLASLVQRFQQPAYKTQYPNLYFANEVGNRFLKEYVSFINIRDADSTLIGYVVLDLKLRSETPRSVYPELLVDDKLSQSPAMRDYSYAIFSTGSTPAMGRPTTQRLLLSTGSYNYERKLPVALLTDPALYDKGISVEGYDHLGIKGTNNRTLVVSSEAYPYQAVLASFSFLYLLLVLSVIMVIVLYAVQYGLSRFSINYSTRIQILLNVAFFLPLLLVVLIILGVISANYISNQQANYLSNTKNIASNFWTYLEETQKKLRSKESMEQELQTIARDADIDINVFNTDGQLYTSTRPLMYESGHLSKYINPSAFIHIVEDKETQKLLNESLGTKQFSTVYTAIKAYDGKLLGILSVPYFYARPELDRQLLDVVSSALSVFTALFLLFLVLSYFASNSLTGPLRLLTHKIRRTSLDRLNQTIEWKSDDEIGAVIKEYNRMLAKLEESKVSLAQSEKQSAWREMAKQVAHEIKNPLTPMKLTLQQLQRTLPGMNPVTDRAVSRTLDTLLDQINNISDIATSFSDFANMPLPQNELVELASVLNKVADLYNDDRHVVIRRQIETGPVWIMGDRQLLMRIFTNLIINGIQSVEEGKRPVVDLRLFTTDGNANIEVHDNGVGIPENIRSKVFLPNFSTKQGGNGIGLALSKRGIEHASGSIWFETQEAVGTSFFIALPLVSQTRPVHN
ncbi:HAMP domain-containing histidine kinase [Fibrella sp. HMF5335]|uniref:histidine kinase n=1 Tax=Fibrella rubiginis TaxID=2817060 RepID=A0A939GL38_9BACT|nr:HAMP domain-containing sensor histidine kinase [Fibrella rubiginis]MBO0938402.1 HAMP domain-containing histidine kinase [Fibrella rubiginis]